VREVEELQDAIDHRVAERDQPVEAADRDAGDYLLEEEVPVVKLEGEDAARSLLVN
jgi:hypothetical protein